MVHSLSKKLTLAEFLQQPETKPTREYINGEIFSKPMPQGKHSILQGELVSKINAVAKPARTALALPELRGTFGDRSIVPDVAVFAWDRIPVEASGDIANGFPAAPDWTIEILSPDQSQTRVTGNILYCLEHESTIGWLIDPDERSVIVYWAQKPPELLHKPTDKLPIPQIAPGLELTIEDLFGWLQIWEMATHAIAP